MSRISDPVIIHDKEMETEIANGKEEIENYSKNKNNPIYVRLLLQA
jgi:hypothetical protein